MVKTTPSFPMIHGEYQMGITSKNGKNKIKCCGILCQIINVLEIEHFQNNPPLLASSSKGVYFKNVFMGCYRKHLVPNFMSILTKRNER
jgi:hypothetical protein